MAWSSADAWNALQAQHQQAIQELAHARTGFCYAMEAFNCAVRAFVLAREENVRAQQEYQRHITNLVALQKKLLVVRETQEKQTEKQGKSEKQGKGETVDLTTVKTSRRRQKRKADEGKNQHCQVATDQFGK